TDFMLDFGNWTQYDLDGDGTWGSADYDFPNEFYTGSFIIFNPSQTTPSATDPAWQPHSGNKFTACFAANPGPNDDWLITPQLKIATGDELSFYHKSVTDIYGLERFRVGISTTGTDPADFTIITPTP
ncbi:choice-of-anchor J domain-containing protein, partial [Arthrospira platensis SPKY1]|nr:choice-of-anchor J domain-containing protein [Arthrospira platensis SPKY1]